MASGFDLTATARSLLNIEVNTILRDNMTAEPMPPLPHAILDIAEDYARRLVSFGVDLAPYFAAPADALGKVEPTWTAAPAPVSGYLTVSGETFERIRLAARNAAGSAAAAPRRLDSSERVLLDRIINNCDEVKEILKRLGADFEPFRNKTRAELASETIRRGAYAVQVDDMVSLQKIWDIGTEEIMAQTVVFVNGNVTTRVQQSLLRPELQQLFGIHRQAVDVSVSCWHYLLDAVRELAGTTVRALLGRTG